VADIVSPAKRSYMMSRIRGKNTRPELIIRKGLHKKGFRYRLHHSGLHGKPDMVLAKYNAVIFINGCFWHGHNCCLFKWPASRPEFWKEKITKNRENDMKNKVRLRKSGWRVLTIWECSLKGRGRYPDEAVIEKTKNWLLGGGDNSELRGTV